MPKNSFLQAMFKGPKFSLAPIEQNNRGSLKIGEVVPVFSTILNPREGIQLDLGHLVRFMPAKAPTMEGYKVQFDAFAVPMSCLGYAERKERDIDDFFNLKTNGGEVANPFCFPMSDMIGESAPFTFIKGVKSTRYGLGSAFLKGSVTDYLNWPSLKGVRDHVRKWLQVNPFAYGSYIDNYIEDDPNLEAPLSSLGWRIARFVALSLLNDVGESELFSVDIDMTGRNHGYCTVYLGCPFVTFDNPLYEMDENRDVSTDSTGLFAKYLTIGTFGKDSIPGCYSLLGYILRNYPAVASYYGFEVIPAGFADATVGERASAVNRFANHLAVLLEGDNPISLDYLQVLYDNYEIDAQSIYDEYFEFVMSKILYKSDIVNEDGDNLYERSGDPADGAFLPSLPSTEPIDMSWLAAYWKIISDWYINTNIDGDPEAFFLNHCRLLTPYDGPDDDTPDIYADIKPFRRRWANDIFTSSVPAASVQNVRIPADGTIPDLREANAYQKLVDIFRNTGNRLRDVVYGVFGITPSAVRSEMSEPIGTITSWIGMQSVLQTSQTTEKSPQAAYAGIGTDSNGHQRILKYVNNEEPTPVIIMVLMSVTQRASYMQGFDRKFFRKSIYDFAVPELAMIGEQEVTNKEIFFDKGYEGGVFGFNRRYYDWFYSGSEVHGELRDTMDYWHGARIFDDQPSLNSEFIGIECGIDHLQRMFANVSESAAPIVYNLSFDGYKTVALPRYIQYEL